MKSRVGLGTFPLANVFSEINKEQAKDIVRYFINRGGYYIDTAPLYGFGEVENLLGEVFGEFERDQYYVVTKCGYIDVEGKTFKTVQKSGKYDDVLRECDISLKRLGIDYIDLYFVHSPDPATPFDETMRALVKLRDEGKIREIGVSNVNLEELKDYNKNGDVSYIQNRFSLINRSINDEFGRYLVERDIKLVPYQVIDRGQLTGRVSEGTGELRDGDLRIGRSDWDPKKMKAISAWSEDYLLPIAQELGISLGQLSIAWALHQKFMGFVIVGSTKQDQVDENLKANGVVLSDKQLEEIDSAYKALEEQIQQDYGQSVREFRGLNEKYY